MKRWMIFLIIIVLFLVTCLYFGSRFKEETVNKVWVNTYLNNKNISGLSKEELLKKESEMGKSDSNEKITFIINNKKITSTYNEVGIAHKKSNIVGSIFENQNVSYLNYIKNKNEIRNYYSEIEVDKEKWSKFAATHLDVILKKPTDGKFKISKGKLETSGGEYGVKTNIDGLSEQLISILERGGKEIKVPLTPIKPKLTKDDIKKMGIGEIISSYKTTFNTQIEGRTNNVKLAAEAINGTVLAPDEVFDYNEIVGPRTKKRGYQAAPVFMKGEVVEDLGGGICQVSTTLYNAVLYADLSVVERHNHGLPISYVPAGRDATVSYGSLNFKFKNTTNHYIYIEMYTEGNQLYSNIYGTTQGKTVYLESKVISHIQSPKVYTRDSNLREGEQFIERYGVNGYRSETWKIVKENGVIISNKKISTDTYKAQTTKIKYN